MTLKDYLSELSVEYEPDIRIGNAESKFDIEKMSVTLELITPRKAAAWLENAADNRKFSHEHAGRLGRSLEETQWRVISQGIGFDTEGRCIDGQHRLWAILQSGVSAYLVVVRGLLPDTIKAIDETRKRSFGDDLRIEGHEQYSMSAAFTGQALRWERAVEKDLQLGTTRNMQLSRIEQDTALKRYEENCDLPTILKVAGKANKEIRIPASSVSASYYLALQRWPEHTDEVDEFFEKLAYGYNMDPTEPVAAARKAIRGARDNKREFSTIDATALLLYCLRQQLKGKSLSKVNWSAILRRSPRELLS